MPEFTAPGLGRESSVVTVDAQFGENASGVLYALGGSSGGLVIIERTTARAREKLAPGKHRIEVDTTIAKPGGPAEVVIRVDGKEAIRTTVARTVPAALTASETLDVGIDLGAPVSLDYFDRKPFPFNGRIDRVTVELKPHGSIGRAHW